MVALRPETTSPTTPRPSRKVSTMPVPEVRPGKYEEILKTVPFARRWGEESGSDDGTVVKNCFFLFMFFMIWREIWRLVR